MKSWLAALCRRLGKPIGETVAWWASDGQCWVATACDHCHRLHNSKPVAGMKVTPERVPVEERRMALWDGGGF